MISRPHDVVVCLEFHRHRLHPDFECLPDARPNRHSPALVVARCPVRRDVGGGAQGPAVTESIGYDRIEEQAVGPVAAMRGAAKSPDVVCDEGDGPGDTLLPYGGDGGAGAPLVLACYAVGRRRHEDDGTYPPEEFVALG